MTAPREDPSRRRGRPLDPGLPRADHGRRRPGPLLAALADILAGPGGGASRALLGVLDAEPVLAEAYRRGPLARWDHAFREAFRRAAARGEVPEGTEDSVAAASGVGILIQRWLVTGEDVRGDFVVQVVDEVMMPLLSP